MNVYSVITVRPASFATTAEVRRDVEAYLYPHSNIVETVIGRSLTGFVVRTAADTDERADYLATYQCERFRSGLIGASVQGTLDAAIHHAITVTDGGLVMCPSHLIGEHRGEGYDHV